MGLRDRSANGPTGPMRVDQHLEHMLQLWHVSRGREGQALDMTGMPSQREAHGPGGVRGSRQGQ